MKRALLALVVALILVQFVRPERNLSGEATNDITKVYTVPDNVQPILKKACYDCHSNHTEYPWYTNIQPAGLWMQHHVNEGKGELNFNEFAKYTPKRQNHKMEELIGMVEENEMPLSSYTWIHKNAILTAEEKNALIYWAKGIQQQIKPLLNK
jgi:hypothetical protein